MVLNSKLIEITPFQDEDARWFLKLVYEYEDAYGKFKRIFPKVGLPFPSFAVPLCKVAYPGDSHGELYIACFEHVPLYEATCDLAIERGVTIESVVFDISIEEKARKMTVSEIEEQLGYKIKVVDKESES